MDDTAGLSSNERIVHATLELIAARGLGGVTMSQIAQQANVARQTLYNHYPDVESIVSSAMAQHAANSARLLSEMLATVAAPDDRIEHLVRHVAATAAHGHPVIRQGFSAEMQAVIDGYDQAMRSHIEAILRDGAAAGIFRRDLVPATDALVIQRMVEAVGELVTADPDSAAETVTATTKTVLAALSRS